MTVVPGQAAAAADEACGWPSGAAVATGADEAPPPVVMVAPGVAETEGVVAPEPGQGMTSIMTGEHWGAQLVLYRL